MDGLERRVSDDPIRPWSQGGKPIIVGAPDGGVGIPAPAPGKQLPPNYYPVGRDVGITPSRPKVKRSSEGEGRAAAKQASSRGDSVERARAPLRPFTVQDDGAILRGNKRGGSGGRRT
eukprot:CAMPEP_0182899312 /NCGR_PEP_ID=MMETSP0034_2-20130328/28008_1 /TAXON_ID=156128 /ORGANISM="Nephroselmis pyriformis, Strain CCMP717" /LENGTH=117 /DNA_ID=CAMNT_0025033333 /DNA_START=276 /DNA_END=626 /DNA_ORIENTATION=-